MVCVQLTLLRQPRSYFNVFLTDALLMVLTKFKTQSLKLKTINQSRSALNFKLWFLFFSLQFLISPNLFADSATAESAMVVTQHPKATEVALQILKQGGNAADAAIAAQFVLNVVEPQSSGLGGGGFFLYYDRVKRSVASFDGRETAPASVTPEIFLKDGKPTPFFPDRITGGLSVGVPGTPALIQKVYDRFASGFLSLSQLIDPAIQLAETGVPVSKSLASDLLQHADRLKQFPETKTTFFHEDGTPLREGELLIQPNLAKTLRLFSQRKAHAFYQGEIADAIVKTVNEAPVQPAVLTKEDLKKYVVIEREPIYGNYRGLDVFAPGLPTSGGIVLLENLNMLENFDLPAMGWDSQALHYLNETQKLAFQDRKKLGDPGFSEIPIAELTSKEFAKKRVEKIQAQKALRKEELIPEDGKQTTHFSITDRLGNLVSWTSTIEAPFGSGMMVYQSGFFLNNELTDFDPIPYDANGKLKPNAPGAGKKPLSSMTPVFIFKKGRPYMVLGSPGGTTIIGTVLNVILNRIDFGMPCDEAMAKPRLIYRGEKMEIEPELYEHPMIRLQLELWGHDTEKAESIGNAQTICFDDLHQEIVGVADSRGIGKASGY